MSSVTVRAYSVASNFPVIYVSFLSICLFPLPLRVNSIIRANSVGRLVPVRWLSGAGWTPDRCPAAMHPTGTRRPTEFICITVKSNYRKNNTLWNWRTNLWTILSHGKSHTKIQMIIWCLRYLQFMHFAWSTSSSCVVHDCSKNCARR